MRFEVAILYIVRICKQNPKELSLPDNDIVSKSEQKGRTVNLQFYNESDTIQMNRIQEKTMRLTI